MSKQTKIKNMIKKAYVTVKSFAWVFPIMFVVLFFLFFGVSKASYDASTLYVYKSSTESAAVYTTFGPMPVYRITGETYYGDSSISAISITPNSTTIDDTNVTLTFYNDVDNSGDVSPGDVNLPLAGSGTFSSDNAETTFTFSSPMTVAGTSGNHGFAYILIVASGTGVDTNTFNITIPSESDFTCDDLDNACHVSEYYGTIGVSPTTLTVSSTAPSITVANGASNPSTIVLGPNSTNASIQQLAFVNSSATADIITSIQVTPTGDVAEKDDFTLRIWREGTYEVLLASNAWTDNLNGTTTFTINGGGFRVAGSATTNFLFTLAGTEAGTASGGETHGHQVPISGITTLSGTTVTLAEGQSNPLTSATATIDATPPNILAIYSTGENNVDVTFDEPIDDSTYSYSANDFELDLDSSNDGVNEYTDSSYSSSTNVTYPSADTDADDEYFHITSSGGPATSGLIYLHYDGTSLKDLAGNALLACNACGTEYDGAHPDLLSSNGIAFATDTGGRNKATFTFTEDIFLDNTNQDGTLDDGDTTDGESTVSTSSFGSFGKVLLTSYWPIKGLLKQWSTGPDVTQPVDGCNTLSVSGRTLTVTFNTVPECYFSGTTWPSISSMLNMDDGSTPTNLLYATSGYDAHTKTFEANLGTYVDGWHSEPPPNVYGQIDYWDITAPSTVTAGSVTAGSTTITPTWTPITDTYFGEYIIAYRTTTGADISNGTLWSSADDTALATATTASTTITGLTTGLTYYYVVYARDAAGNLSAASSEVDIETSSPSPLLTGAAYEDSDGNGTVNRIKLTFDQTINTCTATGVDFAYTANDITNSVISTGTVTCSGADEYVYITMSTPGGPNITSHSTAPTLAYTDYASREISNTVNGQVATFGVQDVTDGAGPVVVSASTGDNNNDGKTDGITVTYSESLADTSSGTNGFNATSAGNHGSSCYGEAADPSASSTLSVSFTCTGYYTAVGDMNLVFTANSGVKDAANNQSPTVTLTNSSTPAITDGAQPVLISATKGTASNQNKLTLVYSEPMYLDLNSSPMDMAGRVDDGDITSTESMTSTSGVGGISSAGTIRKIGTFGTAGTVTQNAETNNTVAVSSDGLTVTVTLNTATGSYFTNSVTPPSGTFTPTDTVTAPCVLAQTPNATTSTQRVNSSATAPTSSGSWDLTAPDQITGFTPGTTGATFIPMTWSPITAPSDFASFKLYYSGFSGVTNTSSNGTLLVDSTLSTGSTSQATISGLERGARYYFVIYAVDIAGNLSTVSSEATDAASVKNAGGGGGAAAAATAVTIPPVVDTVPPSAPSGQNAEYKDGKILLTWTDPRNSDFADIEICKKGTTDTCVIVSRGMQNYTDTNFNIGDTVKYILKAKDITGNNSTNTEELTVVARQAHVVTAEEKNLIEEEIALLEKSISTMDKVLALYNVQIKKLDPKKVKSSVTKKKNAETIAKIKSVMRRIELNKKKQVASLNELKAELKLPVQ